ncbi:harmonin isoform X1 [Patella vulgata]|uniref:harmonin isoform X1 n=1 Tax=Patella vulgata TaxID=6465 RepID=UPI00217F9705|nr:harmonin isoform X1 [Patella vulgata]
MSEVSEFGSKFNNKVKELIEEENDRELLFASLRSYQSELVLETLLADLRRLFNDPTKLELYEHIRPLILLKHQIEYSRTTPNMPGVKLRVVRLQRQPGESLGFAVRGGFEHGVGVFVSDVQPNSQAQKRGLKIGDEIVRVNGFTISEAIHEDVLNLIKSREEIVLKVTHIGMLPNKETPNENVTWSYVEKMDSSKALQEVLDGAGNKNRNQGNELKIFINTSGASSIGCGILSGPNHFPGIFIEKVKPDSLAEEAGLEVGDQIVEVNGTPFQGISHKEAVVTLKGSHQLDMVIRKNIGTVLFEKSCRQTQQQPLKIAESTAPDNNEAVERYSSPTLPDRNYRDDEITFSDESRHTQRSYGITPSSETSTYTTGYNTGSDQIKLDNHDDQNTHFSSTVISPDQQKSDISTLREELDTLKQRREVLGGKAAILAARSSNAANKPSLLGAANDRHRQLSPQDFDKIDNPRDLFKEEDIRGKDLELVKLTKNKPLGIEIEGGIGTPLADRIQVAEIYTDGCIFESGDIQVGDQLMMIDGKSLLNMSVAQARNILTEADNKSQDILKIVIAKGSMINDEDAVTFF